MTLLSHDEVVHGKGSLLGKMHGDPWRRFANLRLLYNWQWTLPGKKLLFMGREFARVREWSQDRALDWSLLQQDAHAGVQRLVRDLNALLESVPPLHRLDFDRAGFQWITCDDRAHSVQAFLRRDERQRSALVVLDFTPVVRHGYRVGVPAAGRWVERLNSEPVHYGGSNRGNFGGLDAEPMPCMGHAQSLSLTLPPLAGLVLARDEELDGGRAIETARWSDHARARRDGCVLAPGWRNLHRHTARAGDASWNPHPMPGRRSPAKCATSAGSRARPSR